MFNAIEAINDIIDDINDEISYESEEYSPKYLSHSDAASLLGIPTSAIGTLTGVLAAASINGAKGRGKAVKKLEKRLKELKNEQEMLNDNLSSKMMINKKDTKKQIDLVTKKINETEQAIKEIKKMKSDALKTGAVVGAGAGAITGATAGFLMNLNINAFLALPVAFSDAVKQNEERIPHSEFKNKKERALVHGAYGTITGAVAGNIGGRVVGKTINTVKGREKALKTIKKDITEKKKNIKKLENLKGDADKARIKEIDKEINKLNNEIDELNFSKNQLKDARRKVTNKAALIGTGVGAAASGIGHGVSAYKGKVNYDEGHIRFENSDM